MRAPLQVAYSPCPNDTFIFGAWAHGAVGEELPIDPHLADIELLNQWALEGRFPLSKVSWAVLPKLLDNYIALPVGAALGWGVGPKIVAKEPFPVDEIASKRIAVPGQHTTAHLLLQCLLPEPKAKVYCLFHETTRLLNNGVVDCSLIIHEQRFTFERAGFIEIADLGEVWEQEHNLPLPLGLLVAKRTLDPSCIQQICHLVRRSMEHAYRHPVDNLPYILQYAQEMEPTVVRQHIETYVTKESGGLSAEGRRAAELLLNLRPTDEWLFDDASALCSSY